MTPSPMAKVLRFEPRPTEPRSHVHPSQARPFDWATDEHMTVMLTVSPLEASLIVSALRASSMAAARELGDKIAADIRARRDDECNPHGIRRPDGA